MDTRNTYEGMFLLDAGSGDFDATAKPIHTVLARGEAEILACKPWDERKLAYPVKGRKRGLYVLTYFRADPQRIWEIEHDAQLNEDILRALILRKEHLSEEELGAETPATASARRAAARAAREAEPKKDSNGGGGGAKEDSAGPKDAASPDEPKDAGGAGEKGSDGNDAPEGPSS